MYIDMYVNIKICIGGGLIASIITNILVLLFSQAIEPHTSKGVYFLNAKPSHMKLRGARALLFWDILNRSHRI